MRRRLFLSGAVLGAVLRAASAESARGRLAAGLRLEMAGGKVVRLEGDEATLGVLRDERLAGADFEIAGRWKAPDLFAANPIHTRALFVHRNGRKLVVTYWCEVCAIRTYTPGVCSCCQEYTKLDFRAPDDPMQ